MLIGIKPPKKKNLKVDLSPDFLSALLNIVCVEFENIFPIFKAGQPKFLGLTPLNLIFWVSILKKTHYLWVNNP